MRLEVEGQQRHTQHQAALDDATRSSKVLLHQFRAFVPLRNGELNTSVCCKNMIVFCAKNKKMWIFFLPYNNGRICHVPRRSFSYSNRGGGRCIMRIF